MEFLKKPIKVIRDGHRGVQLVNNPYKQYKKTQIDTANQGKLIVMLYDGAIKFINKAIELMPSKKIEDIHTQIVKAQDIISELIVSLNMDVGDISNRLLSIYLYMNKKLIEANMKKEIEPLIEVRKYLIDLRSAWEEAAKKAPTDNLEPAEKGGVNIAT
jgi:flagellar secretion chaperone FliS